MSRFRRQRRGFTLAEMLIYMGVLSVFTLGLYSVFGLSVRHYKISEARNDSAQSSLIAVGAINRLLVGGKASSLAVDPVTGNPPTMLFVTGEPQTSSRTFLVNGAGQVLWQRWICIWYDASTRRILMSQETTNLDTDAKRAAPSPTGPQATLTNSFTFMRASLSRRVLARDVTGFTLERRGTGQVYYTITTGVRPSVTTRTTSAVTIGVSTSGYFTLRN